MQQCGVVQKRQYRNDGDDGTAPLVRETPPLGHDDGSEKDDGTAPSSEKESTDKERRGGDHENVNEDDSMGSCRGGDAESEKSDLRDARNDDTVENNTEVGSDGEVDVEEVPLWPPVHFIHRQ